MYVICPLFSFYDSIVATSISKVMFPNESPVEVTLIVPLGDVMLYEMSLPDAPVSPVAPVSPTPVSPDSGFTGFAYSGFAFRLTLTGFAYSGFACFAYSGFAGTPVESPDAPVSPTIESPGAPICRLLAVSPVSPTIESPVAPVSPTIESPGAPVSPTIESPCSYSGVSDN